MDGYSIAMLCLGTAGQGEMTVDLQGSGAVQHSYSSSRDDDSASALTVPGGKTLSNFGYPSWFQTGFNHGFAGSTTGHYFRANGTAVIHGASVVTLVFDAFIDDRGPGPTKCSLRGSATPAH